MPAGMSTPAGLLDGAGRREDGTAEARSRCSPGRGARCDHVADHDLVDGPRPDLTIITAAKRAHD